MSIVMPFVCPVSGISQYQQVAAQVRVGGRLSIRHEPDNPYDGNACRIDCEAGLLGYVPKRLAARLVGSGSRWEAEVEQVLTGQQCLGVRVRVLGVMPVAPDHANEGSFPEDSAVQAAPGELGPQKAVDPGGKSLRVVRALSGRILGELVEDRPQSQLVRVSDRVVEYPKSLLQA